MVLPLASQVQGPKFHPQYQNQNKEFLGIYIYLSTKALSSIPSKENMVALTQETNISEEEHQIVGKASL